MTSIIDLVFLLIISNNILIGKISTQPIKLEKLNMGSDRLHFDQK